MPRLRYRYVGGVHPEYRFRNSASVDLHRRALAPTTPRLLPGVAVIQFPLSLRTARKQRSGEAKHEAAVARPEYSRARRSHSRKYRRTARSKLPRSVESPTFTDALPYPRRGSIMDWAPSGNSLIRTSTPTSSSALPNALSDGQERFVFRSSDPPTIRFLKISSR
jgi:hypothetical protein